MEEKNLNWEEFNKDNPWRKEIFNIDTNNPSAMKDLIDEICSGKRKFIYSKDKGQINEKRFELSLLPKPYRGNLKDPKLVILSLNPGYNERVKTKLFKMLKYEHQKRFIEISKKNALLESRYIISPDDEVDDVMDNGYWSDRLSELKNDGAEISRIGLIQFVPYASEHFGSWNKKELETQKFTREIIMRLLTKSRDTLFLVMRSKDKWKKLIPEMDNKEYKDKFLYNQNPRCQNLSKNNLKGNYEIILDKLKKYPCSNI